MDNSQSWSAKSSQSGNQGADSDKDYNPLWQVLSQRSARWWDRLLKLRQGERRAAEEDHRRLHKGGDTLAESWRMRRYSTVGWDEEILERGKGSVKDRSEKASCFWEMWVSYRGQAVVSASFVLPHVHTYWVEFAFSSLTRTHSRIKVYVLMIWIFWIYFNEKSICLAKIGMLTPCVTTIMTFIFL